MGGQGQGGSGGSAGGPGSGGAGNSPGPGSGGSADGGGGANGGMGGAGAFGGMGAGGMGMGGMGTGGMGANGGGGAGGMMPICTQILLDPSYEGGSPNAAWTESSTLFTTPLCSVASGCNGAVGSGARTGTWWFWGGGAPPPIIGADQEVSIVSQVVTIPVGTATLDWYMEMPNCDTGVVDFFGIRVDGTVVYQTDTLTDPACGQLGYQQRSVDLAAYANGGQHTVEFIVDQLADWIQSVGVTNVFVDDVALTSCQ